MSVQKDVSLGTKLAYGFGAAAYGIKDNGFNYFLLLFYSQVMGVDAPLVGLALLLAMIFDSLSDPIVGYLSDNTHSRFGRRHPWMYAAALPISVTYYMLWSPPESLSGNELFPYILVLSIIIRTFITFYEVPSSALAAEFTDHYDERTSLMSYRYFFGWASGTAMATLALGFILVPTDTIAKGIMNKSAYDTYGLVAACMIFLSIIVSSLGTHHHIPKLRAPPPKAPLNVRRLFSEIYETLATRSFFALFIAALLGSAATGLSAGLNYYISSYYWEFTTEQMSQIAMSVVISAVLALVLAPIISRKLGKKKGAIIIGLVAFTIAPMPVALRLFDLMPDNGDPSLFPIILVVTILDVAFIIATQTLMSSMIADLVEESEVKTARRSEGVFFAAITFSRKAVQGFGVMGASLALSLAEFPKGVAPGNVHEDAVFMLGVYYAPSLFLIWMLMIFTLKFYRIDRTQHEENLGKLARKITVK